MMPTKPRFIFDEEGSIRLLKKDLYSRNDVYIRELLQNALDSNATNVDLYFLCTNNQKAWGIYCHDNGTGMTKNDIQNYFLCLCKPRVADNTPHYARFGIGIFTYLAFAEQIQLCTKSTKGKAWFLSIDVPSRINSFSDIRLSDINPCPAFPNGTSILLKLRAPVLIEQILDSINWYIRYTLPTPLNLKILEAAGEDLTDYTSFMDKLESAKPLHSHYNEINVPNGAYLLPRENKFKGGYLKLMPGYSDKIVLCEDGILIDESCLDLIPKDFSSLGFQGLINVERGWLDIDAARLKANKSDKYEMVKEYIENNLSKAIVTFFNNNEVHAKSVWNSNATLLNRVLTKVSTPIGAEMLHKIQNNVFLDLVSYSYYDRDHLTRGEIAEKSTRTGVVYYLDGLYWGWRRGIGELKDYVLELFVSTSDYAKIAHSKGTKVVILPKDGQKGLLIPESILERYFESYYGINLHDITNVTEGRPADSHFPYDWRNTFDIPSNLSVGKLPSDSELFLDYSLDAVVDLNKGLLKVINSKISEGVPFTGTEKKLVELYLYFLSANFNEGMSKLENIIESSLNEKRKRVSFSSLMEVIENGG